MTDYLNPERIYTSPRIDVAPGFDSARVGVSKTENTTVKESLTAEDEDEVVYASGQKSLPVREMQYLDIDENGMVTGVRSSRDSKAAAGGENAEIAEKRRDGAFSATAANGQQVKNRAGTKEIASGTRELQLGTSEEGSQIAIDWFRSELTALYLWAKDPCLVEPLTLYELEHAEAIAEYFQAAIDALAKTGSETVPNRGTETRQSAEAEVEG